MNTIVLKLFGGRIDCIKFALKLAIKNFEKSDCPDINEDYKSDMTAIYKSMLTEVEEQDSKTTPTNDYQKKQYMKRYHTIKCQLNNHIKNNAPIEQIEYQKGALAECEHILRDMFGLRSKDFKRL